VTKAIVYTQDNCPYCVAAKDLLVHQGVEVEEINVGGSPGLRSEMRDRSGGRATTPQVFIGDRHIGGCDDLYVAAASGRLVSTTIHH